MSTTTPERIDVPATISDSAEALPCEWYYCDAEAINVIRAAHLCCGRITVRAFCESCTDRATKNDWQVARLRCWCGYVWRDVFPSKCVHIISVTRLRGGGER